MPISAKTFFKRSFIDKPFSCSFSTSIAAKITSMSSMRDESLKLCDARMDARLLVVLGPLPVGDEEVADVDDTEGANVVGMDGVVGEEGEDMVCERERGGEGEGDGCLSAEGVDSKLCKNGSRAAGGGEGDWGGLNGEGNP